MENGTYEGGFEGFISIYKGMGVLTFLEAFDEV
jgi:hypothetical protein